MSSWGWGCPSLALGPGELLKQECAMNGPDLLFALCACCALGMWFGYRLWGKPKPPTALERLTEGDLRLFFVTLRPFLRNPAWPTDASITLWNDGRVHVDAHLLGGSRVQGDGESLHAATSAIRRNVEMIDKAIP
jgi:hypothetical protein